MPVPVRFLIGSPRRLFVAVVLFILLDLSVLIINLWIAHAVAMDAVAINLAGRQRMLSQRTTKASLLASTAPTPTAQQDHEAELAKSLQLFLTTLHAFDRGGAATGGDGAPVELRRVEREARAPVERTLQLVQPIETWLDWPNPITDIQPTHLPRLRDYLVEHNREILTRMNELTTALEHQSVERIGKLRIIQTTAFVLAILNFVVIVLGLVKQYRIAQHDGEQWRKLAQRDSLTGLYNHAAFGLRLEQALQEAAQSGNTLAVLMIDLDGFKPINDRYGHATGDKVLKIVARDLLNAARESDIVARVGGDEFAILCPGLHHTDSVHQLCERIFARFARSTAEEADIPTFGSSIGIGIYPDDGDDADSLMHAADTAMYASKQAGGHRFQMTDSPHD